MDKGITPKLPTGARDAFEDAARRYQWTESEVLCAVLGYDLFGEGSPHVCWNG
jgi:hypothetical protein